jgi:hypothetical protein
MPVTAALQPLKAQFFRGTLHVLQVKLVYSASTPVGAVSYFLNKYWPQKRESFPARDAPPAALAVV